jgi:hypothetical protein
VTRGIVLPLTAEQRVNRLLYLAGELPLGALDPYVRRDPAELRAGAYRFDGLQPIYCPELYYLLHEHNGGTDPCAPDPASRWTKPGSTFVNRTCDCVGGQSWAGGWDRYQPTRFAHLYDGWINTNSMILDACGPQRCFVPISRPEPGDMIVYASWDGVTSPKVGHVAGIVGYDGVEWDDADPDCWRRIHCVEVAAYNGRANRRTTGAHWFGKHRAMFVRSTMTP